MDEITKRRRRNTAKRVALWAAVVSVGIALVWVFYFSDLLAVKKITVVGELQHSSVEEIISLVDIENGVPLAKLDSNQIRESLKEISAIEAVEVRRVWPSEVVLAVTERTPVATRTAGDGWILIDAEGIEFGALSAKPDWLIAISSKTEFAQMAAIEIVPNIPQWLLPELKSIQAESANDVRFWLNENRIVRFGNSQQQSFKFKVLKTLLNIPASVYDISAPNLPITRK